MKRVDAIVTPRPAAAPVRSRAAARRAAGSARGVAAGRRRECQVASRSGTGGRRDRGGRRLLGVLRVRLSGELAREHLDRGPGQAHRQERQKGAAQEGSKRRHAAVITAAAYKKLSLGSRDTAHAEPTPAISAVITSIGDDGLGP